MCMSRACHQRRPALATSGRRTTMASVVALNIAWVCLAGLALGWQNVALSSKGASCKASSAFANLPCTNAIDGYMWHNKGWHSVAEGVGIWLQVNFLREYVLTYGRVMQPFANHEQSRKIKLSFSGDKCVEEHLTKSTARSWTSYEGQYWNEFSLDHIRTNFVRIEVLQVYTTVNNGFIEVEFYTGINPCLLRYTWLASRCYRYTTSERLPWQDARQVCRHDRCSGDLAILGDDAEKSAVLQWLNKGMTEEDRFWVSKSNGSLADTSPETIPTVLLKPQGTLKDVASTTRLRYICETEPTYDHWRNVPSSGGTGDDIAIPMALSENWRTLGLPLLTGFLALCIMAIIILSVVVILGGYRFHKQLKTLGRARTGNQTTLCSHV